MQRLLPGIVMTDGTLEFGAKAPGKENNGEQGRGGVELSFALAAMDYRNFV